MPTISWNDASFETEDPSGVATGNFVAINARMILGYNQINDNSICSLGSCCPAEGAVAMWWFGIPALPQGCFTMSPNMFWNFPHEFLNDGTLNPQWNGCPGPGGWTGYNTCGPSGIDSVTPGTGTDPCLCDLGEFYTALPNIDFSQTGPGVQWLVVSNTNGTGQLDACLEILKIVENQNDWDNTSITCPSAFMEGDYWTTHIAGYTINHGLLALMAMNNEPSNIVETNCTTCVANLYGCLDQNAINTYWDCYNVHIPTTYGVNPNLDSGCCIYPGCPDSSALNYDPVNPDGCGTWANGSWTSGGITDTSCCMYPGCKDGISTPCDNMTPLPNGDPGPIGCVANHTLDCNDNPVIPATGGILTNPAFSSCFTNESPPSPNNDCYYVGCTDTTATNHTPGANGCLYPILDGTQCCEYEGCMDQTATNYGESCHDPMVIYSAAQLTAPCVPDNCIDPPVVGCMDDGCCVDGVFDLVDLTPTTECPNGLHLCPTQGGGPSFSSNIPNGCIPGSPVHPCSNCGYDPLAEEQGQPYESFCACEGVYCNIQHNPPTFNASGVQTGGCIPGTDCCIDIDTSILAPGPYVWSDPGVFGPCLNGTAYPCTGPGSAMEECDEICVPEYLEDCAVFMNDRQGNVYSYGPPTTAPNNLAFLFHDDQFDENILPGTESLWSLGLGHQSGTGSWDIANALIPGSSPEENLIWLYSCRVVDIDQASGTYGQVMLETAGQNVGLPIGIIREYRVAIDPFTIDPGGNNEPAGTINPTYVRDIDITNVCQTFGRTEWDGSANTFKTIGNALVAKDDTTLISVSDTVLEIDISSPTASAQVLFMLPNPTFPTILTPQPTGADTTQAVATGDVIVDVSTGNLTITYYYPPNVTDALVGKFSLGAGIGNQMGDSLGNPTAWYEIAANDTGVNAIFGLFKWDALWYAVQSTGTGGLVYDFDNTTLIANPIPIGTVTTQPLAATGGFMNDIVGASQKDGCTPDDDQCCCDTPGAINYDPACTNPDPILCPCFFAPEPRMGCLPRLTKEEFLMNVVQKPETYSDIFIERGKVSVFERPQRLAQVSTIGELELHGYGYYNILIQE